MTSLFLLLMAGGLNAAQNTTNGLKLGMAFDRGFGVTGAANNLNGFIGNKGFAIDYIFQKGPLKLDIQPPIFWYVGAGAYFDWDDDIGVRLPIGSELYITKQVDLYAQLIPRLRLNQNTKFGLDAAVGIRFQF